MFLCAKSADLFMSGDHEHDVSLTLLTIKMYFYANRIVAKIHYRRIGFIEILGYEFLPGSC